ncbi:MAG: CoA transferase [Hydrogenibacillus sp.]|nr:CoA transferase [Hydrogenibacillus sp.]
MGRSPTEGWLFSWPEPRTGASGLKRIINGKGGAGLGSLDGVRILDLSRVLAGPFATMILADLGADVVKIEPPHGDETRAWGPPFWGELSAYFLTVNRNKRSLVLDLKDAEARAVFLEMVQKADVVVENFKPGTMQRFGLDYAVLERHNPRLIYAAISGFGQNGPYAKLPGYDFIIQAMGGMMAVTGEPDGAPMKVGAAIADLAAGFYAAIGILAALRERDQSGRGQFIDISLFDAEVALLANTALNYLVSGERPKRYGNAHPNIVPYQVFQAQDGPFVVAVGNDRQFQTLCQVIGAPELALDARFATNADRLAHREALIARLSAVFAARPVREWVERLRAAGVPVGAIWSHDVLFDDPHVAAREMKRTIRHPELGDVPQLGSPLKLSRTPVEFRLAPPRLGEGAQEALLSYGIDPSRLAGQGNGRAYDGAVQHEGFARRTGTTEPEGAIPPEH